MRKLLLLCGVTLALGCSSSSKSNDGSLGSRQQQLTPGVCGNHALHITDVHADFREIWKGLESATSGKQASPYASVTFDFNAAVQASSVSGSFDPLVSDGSCGASVPTALPGAVIAPNIWGNVSSNAARKPQPRAFNLLALESISGVVSSAGPIAAGGDITLGNMSINSPANQTFGVIAGGKVTLTSGAISGNLSYGTPSTVPQAVSVSGQKSLQRFLVGDAFQSLGEVSNLVANASASGSVQLSYSTLKLTGTSASTTVFRVAADLLAQSRSIEINVPNGAAAIVDVTGPAPQLVSKGISLQGVTPNRLLWNFAQASTVTVASISVPGSILAPQARFTFTSGDINGTIVARSFTSPGSGSLRYAPLDAAAVFAPIASSSVTLMPAQALVHDCDYRLTLPSTQPIGAANACLDLPFSVTFHVAGDRLVASDRELTSVQRDRTTGSLQRFAARAGINTPVADALTRYEGAIGVGHAELSPGVSRASFVKASEQFALYEQVSQGYPIPGYGYSVSSENGIFRSAFGKVMPGLPTMPSASVSEASALQAVLTALHVTKAPWLANAAAYHAPHGQLVIAPSRPYPALTDFKLTWRFPLDKRTGLVDAIEARVDATTGKVTSIAPGTESITTFVPDPQNFDGVDTANLVSTFAGENRQLSVAVYHQDSGSVATLATDEVSKDGAVATALDPNDEIVIDTSKLLYVTDPTPDGTWSPQTELVETRMGVVQWTLEKVTKFLPSLQLQQGDLPWSHLDGSLGKRRVLAAYFDGSSGYPTGYRVDSSDASLALITIRNTDTRQYFTPSGASHEYAHALVHSLRNYSYFDKFHEPASVDEGIADLFAATHAQADNLATPWYCIYVAKPGDVVPSVCLRNVADPKHSETAQTAAYFDPLYKDYSSTLDLFCPQPGNDNCGAHQNASIVSHWGYLLATGSDPSNSGVGAPAACGLTFPGADADLGTSLRIATNLALSATPELSSSAGFNEFRDATLHAASGLAAKLNKPDLVEQVSLAWAGMGLPPDSMSSTKVAPVDDSKVSPWIEFAWPTNGLGQSGTSWDFQLATSSAFDAASLKYSSDSNKPISAVSDEDKYPEPRAFIDLALPSEPATRYYWRVRPHDTSAWQQCYPIHSFETTGMNAAVDKPRITANIVKPKAVPILLRPGTITAEFGGLPLAKSYQVSVRGPDDAHCNPNNQQFAETTAACDDCTQAIPSKGPQWLLPQHNYALDIMPIGPPDLLGNPAQGECSNIDFDTDKMRAPSLDPDGYPADNAYFLDGLSNAPLLPAFQWHTFDGTVENKLRFYPINDAGKCPTSFPQSVAANCGDDCVVRAEGTDLPKPPNLAGYCWDVIALAGDGTASDASPQRKFLYEHAPVTGLTPGAQLTDALGMVMPKNPAPLQPSPSYGKPVTLSWSPDASDLVSEYVVRLDRWEGLQLDSGVYEPDNCVLGAADPFGLGGGCNKPIQNIALAHVPRSKTSTDVAGLDEHKPDLSTCPSCGRYCWAVWPVFVGADGKELKPPLPVQLDRHCYTSDPSKPEIIIDSPADLAVSSNDTDTKIVPKFTGQTITGHIHYDYVPDHQLELSATSGEQSTADVEMTEGCKTTYVPPADPNVYDPAAAAFAPYQDVYNCDVKFTIKPHPSQTYTIETRVYNEPQVAPQTQPKHDVVHDVTLKITTPSCGGEGEGCCAKPKAPCATPDGCFGTQGVDGTCAKCGHDGDACCPTTPGATSFPVTTTGCDAANAKINCDTDKKCHPCGAIGQQCCFANSCNGTARCNMNTKHCDPPPPTCNAPVVPSVSHCESPFDGVSIDFKLVADALTYDVEYTRPDGGTYTKTYAASDVWVDFQPDWYAFPEFEPAFNVYGTGSFRIRVHTSNCTSDWSQRSSIDTSNSCFGNGYCGTGLCASTAPH